MALVEIQCCKVIDATSTPNGFAAACLGLSTRFFFADDGPDEHDGALLHPS
jgi:hypothetical protein